MAYTTTPRRIEVRSPGCYAEDGVTLHRADHVETWYDRSVRSHVAARFCEHGDQLGSATYVGTAADRDAAVRDLVAHIDEHDDSAE